MRGMGPWSRLDHNCASSPPVKFSRVSGFDRQQKSQASENANTLKPDRDGR